MSRCSLARSTLPLNGCSGGVVRLVDDDVDEDAAGELLVRPGGGEVHVARDEVAGLDEDLRDEVLGAAALVGGHDVGEPVRVADGLSRSKNERAPA